MALSTGCAADAVVAIAGSSADGGFYEETSAPKPDAGAPDRMDVGTSDLGTLDLGPLDATTRDMGLPPPELGVRWVSLGGPRTDNVALRAQEGNVLFHTSNVGSEARQFYSLDGGNVILPFEGLGVAPGQLVRSATRLGTSLFVLTTDELYRSPLDRLAFSKVTINDRPPRSLRALESAGGYLFALDEAGGLLRSLDEGETWTELRSNVGTLLAVDDMLLAHAGFGEELWISDDAGGDWRTSQGRLGTTQLELADGVLFALAQGALIRTPIDTMRWTTIPGPELDTFTLHEDSVFGIDEAGFLYQGLQGGVSPLLQAMETDLRLLNGRLASAEAGLLAFSGSEGLLLYDGDQGFAPHGLGLGTVRKIVFQDDELITMSPRPSSLRRYSNGEWSIIEQARDSYALAAEIEASADGLLVADGGILRLGRDGFSRLNGAVEAGEPRQSTPHDLLQVDGDLFIGLEGGWTGAPDPHGSTMISSNPWGGGVLRSRDGGRSFQSFGFQLPRRQGTETDGPADVFALASTTDGTLLASARAGTAGVFRAEFAYWEPSTGSVANLDGDARIHQLVSFAGRVFAAGLDGVIHVSDDDGRSFSPLFPPMANASPAHVAADDWHVVLTSGDGRVQVSSDGVEWSEPVTGTVFDAISSLAIRRDRLIVGAEGSGVFELR